MKAGPAILLVAAILFAQDDLPVGLDRDCGDCHVETNWKNPTFSGFSHATTDFALTGAHRGRYCNACHGGETVAEQHDFRAAPIACDACHIDIHQGRLGVDCNDCHGTAVWQLTATDFDHSRTAFALLGAHRVVDCKQCHGGVQNNDYATTPQDCFSCHREDYEQSTDPAHAAAGLPVECRDCHPLARPTWRPAAFNHDSMTDFLLTGAHRTAQCSGCHDGKFDGINQDCWSCHRTQYDLTGSAAYPGSPDHSQDTQYVMDCQYCHNTTVWAGAEINHDLTAFPLIGAHAGVTCQACHQQGYNLPITCSGCHLPGGLAVTDYLSAAFDHVTHRLPDDCGSCHESQSWSQIFFQHANFSALTCVFCHQVEHTNSIDPAHGYGNIGIDCARCHQTTAWEIGGFTHTTGQTGYDLLGLHVLADCEKCHVNGNYNGTPVTCSAAACHYPDYQSTTDPDHAAYGYPVEYCDLCHQELGWQPDIFQHGLSLACYGCHRPDYEAAGDPVHSAVQGFTTVCEYCHNSTADWTDASFDHGAVTAACATCHLDEYNTTSDPSHAVSGFGQNCESCHSSTTDWHAATFSHRFPIAPSTHQHERTETCQSCHAAPYLAPDYSCTLSSCHSGVDNQHSDDGSWKTCSIGGTTYTYNPTAADNPQCARCHPNGDENDCGGGDRNIRLPDRLHPFKGDKR
ncbi:MAG: hypothetical protein ABIA75_00230 [Candidatus Neomarinimicrobiota bacterium]